MTTRSLLIAAGLLTLLAAGLLLSLAISSHDRNNQPSVSTENCPLEIKVDYGYTPDNLLRVDVGIPSQLAYRMVLDPNYKTPTEMNVNGKDYLLGKVLLPEPVYTGTFQEVAIFKGTMPKDVALYGIHLICNKVNTLQNIYMFFQSDESSYVLTKEVSPL